MNIELQKLLKHFLCWLIKVFNFVSVLSGGYNPNITYSKKLSSHVRD
jgi:hypothetical protein